MNENAKIKIRPQFNGRKNYWMIVQKTDTGSGGWKQFEPGTYSDPDSAMDRAIEITINEPDKYEIA